MISKATEKQAALGIILGICIFLAGTLSILIVANAAVDLVTPANGNFTNQTSVTFEYFTNGINATICDLVIDDSGVASVNNPPQGFNSFTHNIPAGLHQWQVYCTDGNTTFETSARNITVDLNAPSVVLFTPANNDTIRSANATISFVTLDNYATEISCEIILNNQTHYTTSAQNSQPMNINLNSLAQGAYDWRVKCTDSAGNARQSEVRRFNINITAVAPTFGVAIPRTTYVAGEEAYGTVAAQTGSSARVEVCPDISGFVECIIALNVQNANTFPLDFILPFTKYEGKYVLEAYFTLGTTSQTKVERYNITSNLQVDADYPSKPRKNEPIILEAEATGGIQPLSYIWQLSNGSKYTTKKVNITYTTPGNYTNLLIVKDAYNNTRNKSVSIEVSNSLQINFIVTDVQTGAAIKDATIEVDSQKKETDASGAVTMFIRSGMRNTIVLAQNYSVYTNDLNIQTDQTIQIKLQKLITTIKAPQVTLTYPENGQAILGSSTQLGFTVSHDKTSNCSIYIGEDPSGFYTYLGSAEIGANDPDERRFEIIDLENVTYYWKVECIDAQGQSGESETREMYVGLENAFAATGAQTTQLSALEVKSGELSDIFAQIESMPPDLKEAVQAIGLDAQLQNNIRGIKNSVRDIDSLAYENINPQEKATKETAIMEKANALYLASPVYFELTASDSFVDYIEDSELEELTKEVMASKYPNKTFNMKRTLKILDDLQQEIVVSTKTRSLKVNFNDGTVKEYSAIIRDIKTYNLSGGTFIAEQVPKSIAEDASEIKSNMEFEVIKKDPIIAFPIKKDTKIVYYFEKDVDSQSLRDIRTAVYADPTQVELGGTGFSIFAFDLRGSNNIFMIIGIVLIAGLVVGTYKYEGHKVAKYAIYLASKGDTTHYINVIISDINDNLSMGNIEKAVQLYEEAKQAYAELPQVAKNDVFENIVGSAQKIEEYQKKAVTSVHASSMLEMVRQAENILAQSHIAAAVDAYKQIEETYHALDEQTKELVHTQISQLGTKIQIMAAQDKEWR